MKVVESIEYISIDDLFQIVERIVENGMIKVKRKIVKKKKTEPETVKVETSTTSSTSSVFGKSIFKRLGHVICFRRTVVQWYDLTLKVS